MTSSTTAPAAPAGPATPAGTDVRLSLLTPSGHLTLGNYLGALRPMAGQQDGATCFYGLSDLHAMTTRHDPATLRELTRETRLLVLAGGIDPGRATVFQPRARGAV